MVCLSCFPQILCYRCGRGIRICTVIYCCMYDGLFLGQHGINAYLLGSGTQDCDVAYASGGIHQQFHMFRISSSAQLTWRSLLVMPVCMIYLTEKSNNSEACIHCSSGGLWNNQGISQMKTSIGNVVTCLAFWIIWAGYSLVELIGVDHMFCDILVRFFIINHKK